MESDLKRWLAEGLSSQLQLPVDKGVVEYLVAIDTKAEVEDYLEGLLGKKSDQDFIREFLLRWTAIVEERRHHGNVEMIVAHSRQEKEELLLFEPKKTTKKSKKDVKEAPKAIAPPPGFGVCPPQNPSTHKRSETTKKEGGASKTKFVPLLSAEGESQLSIKFPGRFLCQCLGQKHELVNNCLECGRIVCSQVSDNMKY
ncbi:PREDICTED: activating signal cointegrator 1-like isoform X2 [Amphimedon queenslandica]|uniref:Activating signal cointegrator 1 N-terminal domain-containing protein n=1 Tax=Amphimedon queenslandica TaxID=400682 RepID=A0AAN0JFV4_AMPQE|nr:PREDICTED: activating signal cointegrator 1-like isoform X2 [Amphimedon queenslandica]|eukprot:XP_019855839.1 PREDICTED: activating signal cointegrator 1-like isoform X2 [Amphimedon queenslandica]